MKYSPIAVRIALAGSAIFAMSACQSSESTGPLAQYTGQDGMKFIAQCYYDYDQIFAYFSDELGKDAVHIGDALTETEKSEFERMKNTYGAKRDAYFPRLEELTAEQGFENFVLSEGWIKNMVPFFKTDVVSAVSETHPGAGGDPIRFWTEFGDMVDKRCPKVGKAGS